MNQDLNIDYFDPYSENVAIIKSYFKNKNILRVAVLNILLMIFSLGAIALCIVNINELTTLILQSTKEQYGVTISNTAYLPDLIKTITLISLIAATLPSVAVYILTVVAYFNVFKNSRSEKLEVKPKLGFTILFVLTIISLIMMAVSTLSVVFTFIILLITDSSQTNFIYTVISLGSSGIICILGLIYYINKLRYIRNIRKSMSSPSLSAGGAKATGVFRILAAIMYVFIALANIALIIFVFAFPSFPMIEELFSVIDKTSIIIALAYTLLSIVLQLLLYIFSAKISLGYNRHIYKIKTAHLHKYNDGYDENSIAIDNSFEPTKTIDIPKWEVVSEEPKETKLKDAVITPTPAPVEEKPTCPSCNSPVYKEDSFCQHCGQKLK